MSDEHQPARFISVNTGATHTLICRSPYQVSGLFLSFVFFDLFFFFFLPPFTVPGKGEPSYSFAIESCMFTGGVYRSILLTAYALAV